ncbi:hypothetical protein L3Q67_01195 [Saccharothrix sp. AJ9571]|nr:hypothetical protein L3Q67_01195 [Saccharothrix sp. AJ9571]
MTDPLGPAEFAELQRIVARLIELLPKVEPDSDDAANEEALSLVARLREVVGERTSDDLREQAETLRKRDENLAAKTWAGNTSGEFSQRAETLDNAADLLDADDESTSAS